MVPEDTFVADDTTHSSLPHIQDDWVSGLCPSYGILKNIKGHSVLETDPVYKMLCTLMFFRIPDDGQSPKTQ
jgi:hypothetical protein